MTTAENVAIVCRVLKEKFTNLTVVETIDLAAAIISAQARAEKDGFFADQKK